MKTRFIKSDFPEVEDDCVEFLGTDYHFSIDRFNPKSGCLVKVVGDNFEFFMEVDTLAKAKKIIRNNNKEKK
jgi:hypothetical protein